MFKGGTFIDLLLTNDHARQMIKFWASREFRLKGVEISEGTDLNNTQYAYALEEVTLMHTAQVVTQTSAPNTPYGRSGRN